MSHCRQEAQASLALARREADSALAASQLEKAAQVARLRHEADAHVAAVKVKALKRAKSETNACFKRRGACGACQDQASTASECKTLCRQRKVPERLQTPGCQACRLFGSAYILDTIQAAAANASKEAAAAASTADQRLREAETATAAMRSRLDQQGAELASTLSSAEMTAKAGLLHNTLTFFVLMPQLPLTVELVLQPRHQTL